METKKARCWWKPIGFHLKAEDGAQWCILRDVISSEIWMEVASDEFVTTGLSARDEQTARVKVRVWARNIERVLVIDKDYFGD